MTRRLFLAYSAIASSIRGLIFSKPRPMPTVPCLITLQDIDGRIKHVSAIVPRTGVNYPVYVAEREYTITDVRAVASTPGSAGMVVTVNGPGGTMKAGSVLKVQFSPAKEAELIG